MVCFCSSNYWYFNPRSHERSDNAVWFVLEFKYPFQSTLPREERLLQCNIRIICTHISIHAPTRGATRMQKTMFKRRRFQSTLPREERQNIAKIFILLINFNPRSHERSDENDCSKCPKQKISIHAPTRGATKRLRSSGVMSFNFNPRSHERSDYRCKLYCHPLPYFNPRSHERSDVFSRL